MKGLNLMRWEERALLPNLKLSGLAILIGVIGGFSAVIFRYFIILINNLGFHWTLSSVFVSPVSHHLSWLVILLPALGGLPVGLITYYFAPEAKGHGVPEVMEAVAVNEGRMRPRVAQAKNFASGICLSFGDSAGREGPIVQIGSSAGSTLGQWLHLSAEKLKILVGCGATAGVAATFNAPIAGVAFAFEACLN
jgi:Chloride channel protein EriC